MKKINVFFMLLILNLMIFPMHVNAQKYNTIDISYKENNAQLTITGNSDNLDNIYIGEKLSNYLLYVPKTNTKAYFLPFVQWENPDYIIKEGEQPVNVILRTYDGDKINYTITINGIEKANENTKLVEDGNKEYVSESTIEPIVTPSLTVTSVTLEQNSTYDINLENKADGVSTYTWESSNTKVATVNKNGVITSKLKGTATVTCDIKTPETTYSLTSEVIVGLDDDNLPLLSDTDLDLNVGDSFDLDVQNTIAKSKIKFTTSDKTILKVNSSTGKIQCLAVGKADVICTITTGKDVVVLKCNVEVSK